MFDAIGVSGPNRKPWTVATSFAGQVALVGLAILIPMLTTEGLPRRLGWIGLPEPPHGRAPRPAHAAAARIRSVPSQVYRQAIILPLAIPQKAVIIQDPDFVPAADSGGGVVGGMEGTGGSGRDVINSLVSNVSSAAPPLVVAHKEEVKSVKRITVGGLVQAAKLISGPGPAYPALARQARISGVVRLEALISREGTIINLRAVSGHPLLIPAALAAVERWVFRPTYLNGEPVEVATQIDVNFVLQ
ncbi:MAG: energy transducer TonB [Bryobacteraceae bacterium]|jgi:protein TonB